MGVIKWDFISEEIQFLQVGSRKRNIFDKEVTEYGAQTGALNDTEQNLFWRRVILPMADLKRPILQIGTNEGDDEQGTTFKDVGYLFVGKINLFLFMDYSRTLPDNSTCLSLDGHPSKYWPRQVFQTWFSRYLYKILKV